MAGSEHPRFLIKARVRTKFCILIASIFGVTFLFLDRDKFSWKALYTQKLDKNVKSDAKISHRVGPEMSRYVGVDK